MKLFLKYISRIVPRKSAIFTSLIVPLHFSWYFSFLGIILRVFKKLRLERLTKAARDAHEKWIQNYLGELLKPVFSKYDQDSGFGEHVSDAPIWVFWWTGLNDAPEVVQRCIKSVQDNAGSHPVHTLSQDNYTEYIEIPSELLEKVQSGKICLAHFSDYIRVNLLAKYGGLWLDSTIYISQPISDEVFDFPVFSLKGPVRDSEYVGNYRWSTFCLGGWKGNVFYRFLADALDLYWSINDYAITYLFFDSIIYWAYCNIPAVKQLIDSIPDNNTHRHSLQEAMEVGLPASEMEAVMHQSTSFHKLSWKGKWALTTECGEPTVYAKFLEISAE